MTNPYIECAPVDVYNCDDSDVYWIITEDEDGPTARAMFYDLEDAREYMRLVLNVSTDKIKIVKEENT